ncbi:hypothetical protein L1049_020424 [Liquidambar formosana]|uniref:Uncharacterized protein n=1 Tax=Liquidambar formosana TaxID=63359 RepID=A0AAP0S8J7_LIQFO
MLNLQQGLAGNHHFSFINPVYEMNNRHKSTRSLDFDLWDARKNRNYDHFDDLGGSEVEFRAQTNGDDFKAYSPPLWKASRSIKNEVHPLLPQNHCYSNLSPSSRRQVIARGRGELMEMIQNMPESSYELSLKDIVDQENLQDVKQEVVIEDAEFDFKTEVQNKQGKKKKKKKKKKKSSTKKGQISRTGSMDNSNFLLKMFFPSSLSLAKKSTTGNPSKLSPRSSSEGSEKLVRKEWWKNRFSFAAESKTSRRNSNGGSMSSSDGSNGCRPDDINFLPGCWPVFHTKKSKSRGWTGCFF